MPWDGITLAGLIDGHGVEGWGGHWGIEGLQKLTDGGVEQLPTRGHYELSAGGNWFSSVIRNTKGWNSKLNEFPPGAPRYDGGLLVESASSNKCAVYNVGQSGTEGFVLSGPSATIARIDVEEMPAAALARFREIGFDESVVVGVFRFTGENTASVYATGPTGNTNAHSLSVIAYVESGGAQILLEASAATTPVNPGFARTWLREITPAGTSDRWRMAATQNGTSILFFACQLEEGKKESSPMVTEGSATARDADVLEAPEASGATTWFEVRADVTHFKVGLDAAMSTWAGAGTAEERIYGIVSAADRPWYRIRDGGGAYRLGPAQASISVAGTINGKLYGAAGNYQVLFDNDLVNSSVDAAAPPVFSRIQFGHFNGGTPVTFFDGSIARVIANPTPINTNPVASSGGA